MTQRANEGLLRAVDRMMLLFMAALALVTALTQQQPARILFYLAAMALTMLASALAGPRWAPARVIRDFFPLPAVITIFNLAGPLIGAANPARWDDALARLDLGLLGPLVPAWRAALGRPAWLSDVASLLYVSYYFIPVAMAVALYVRGRRSEFEDLTFALIATLLASYVGYFLFPASGPRVPEAQEVALLGGGAISAGVRDFLRVAEINQLDAFPSGHTALSLVFLAYGWRLFPRWRAPLLLAVAGIIFATVYLSLHYAVDLVAGAALAAGVLAAVPQLRRLFGDDPAGLLRAKDVAAS
jgi:membrane-associated phospholipid phosphatase